MMAALFHLLADNPFATIFLVLGLGYLVGRLSLGFFSPGSTAGSLLVALGVGAAAFATTGTRFEISSLVGTIFLALFTYAVGLRVGPQFVEGLRREGAKLVLLVLVTTTVAFAIAYGGSRALGLGPGFAPGILSGSNTISAVMGVATSAVDQGLYRPPSGVAADVVKGNIAAAYSLTYLPSVFVIVLLVRNLPGMFGIDPVVAARRAEATYGAKGHALPGTSDAFTIGMLPNDVRVFRLTGAFVGRRAHEVFERLHTPVLRVTRAGAPVPLASNPVLAAGDLLTVGGTVAALVSDVAQLGPEVADDAARHPISFRRRSSSRRPRSSARWAASSSPAWSSRRCAR